MNKVIIENQSDRPLEVAVMYALAVIQQGKISNEGKNYCYATRFGSGIVVFAENNKKSYRFIVQED